MNNYEVSSVDATMTAASSRASLARASASDTAGDVV